VSALEHSTEYVVTETTPLDWAERLVERYRDTRERRQSLEILKAVRLAPSLEVCEALLRGEKVHPSRLDTRWVKAYGRS
jgi:hypothetical protein